MAVGASHQGQAAGPGQGDGGSVEVDEPRVEVRELDGVEEVELATQAPAERERGRKERMGGDDQPLRRAVPAEVGKGPQQRERDVEVVDEDVAALERDFTAGH